MTEKSRNLFGVSILAIVEIIVMLSIITLTGYMFGVTDRFLGAGMHPYWFVLILIVMQYNLPEVLFCLVMMMAFLYIGNVPQYKISETYFQYMGRIAYLPVLWVFMGILLNSIKARRIKGREKLNDKIRELHDNNELLLKNYSRVEKWNIRLESRLAAESNTAVQVNSVVNILEKMDVNNYADVMEEVIKTVLNPSKFSVYILNPDGLEVKMKSGWLEKDSYKKMFFGTDKLYLNVIGRKDVITVTTRSGHEILEEEGIMAGPLFDKYTGEVCGMMKFEEYRFDHLVSKNIEIFRIVSGWLGTAYIKAVEAAKARYNRITIEESMLYSYNLLTKQTNYLKALADRMNFSLARINIEILNIDSFTREQKNEIARSLVGIVKKNFRTTDEIFQSRIDELGFVILAVGANSEQSGIILSKLKKEMSLINNDLMTKAVFSCTAEILAEKK